VQDFLDPLESRDPREVPDRRDFLDLKDSLVPLDHLGSQVSLAGKEPLVLLVRKFLHYVSEKINSNMQ